MIYRLLSVLFFFIFVVAIICAALPLNIFKKEKPVVHVLLMDISSSVFFNKEEKENLLQRIEPSLSENDYFIRGYFADKSIYMDDSPKKVGDKNLKLLLEEWLDGSGEFKPYLNPNLTNIEYAVRNAFENWSSKGLVHALLVTDTKENNGQLINLIELIKQNDLLLTIVPIIEKPEDIFVKELLVPENISVGQPFELETVIYSTRSLKKIKLNISIGSNTIQKEIDLKKGKNNFIFSTSLANAGINEISVKVDHIDSFPTNNSVALQVKTVDIKEVLVVTEESNSFSTNILANSKVISPIAFPRQVSELLKYNSIVLENIHWNKLLDSGKMVALKEYIIRGGKLFVSGGMNSFGFGDYMGSGLEELLPIKINPSGLVSMVVGIDISGSMESDVGGMRKIDIAINSLLDISKSLEANDEIGVHLYNDKEIKSNIWIPIGKIKEFEGIFNNRRKNIPKPTGGTFILPALESIYQILSVNIRKMRMAVIITDGESQENNFEEVFVKFQKAQPPISVILIGADLSLESPLVLAGKKVFGSNWNPVNINAVGWINLKECFKEALRKMAAGFSDEGDFKIYANQAHPISRTIQPFESPFKGIILKTSLKPGSSALLDIDDRFPLLAHRYLGTGEILSFQSGFYENWSGSWLKSAQGKSFQSMLGSWLQQSKSNPIKLELRNTENGLAVTIHSQLKSMERFAEIKLSLKGQKYNAVRNGNTSWGCVLNYQDTTLFQSNELYQVISLQDEGKEILFGEGIFPPIISKEIFDIYESSLLPDYFPRESIKWRWASEKVPKIELKTYQQVTYIKFFFFVALFSFLLAIFYRGRVG